MALNEATARRMIALIQRAKVESSDDLPTSDDFIREILLLIVERDGQTDDVGRGEYDSLLQTLLKTMVIVCQWEGMKQMKNEILDPFIERMKDKLPPK